MDNFVALVSMVMALISLIVAGSCFLRRDIGNGCAMVVCTVVFVLTCIALSDAP